MTTELHRFMKIAIEEGRQSLREGNHGFGAVLVKNNQVIARAHDREETAQDPTAHAEINVIRLASKKVGKSLAGCSLISTHEPCPMCAAAIVWAKIGRVVFGTSIYDSVKEGRTRLEMRCEEIFARSHTNTKVEAGVLKEECSILYSKAVRDEISKLRNATPEYLAKCNEELKERRLAWFRSELIKGMEWRESKLDAAYHILLQRLGISEEQMPVVARKPGMIVFHSKNFCPTLEACKILGLDTKFICKHYNEEATDALIKQIDPRLKFLRNYNKIRPHSLWCEEMIILDKSFA